MKIEHVPRALVEKFAHLFAGDKMGFSAKEISEYFIGYSNQVKHNDHYNIKLKRADLFINSLYQLDAKYQYYSLNDLTNNKQNSCYNYPTDKQRKELIEYLHSFISVEKI